MTKDSVIETLHKTQESEKQKTYLKDSKMKDVARECGVAPAQVYGVATFYTMFSTTPRGRHIVRVCDNLACHLEKSEELVAALKKSLKVEMGGTSPDGEFTLEETSCLGMCDKAPAMMVDGEMYGNVTPKAALDVLKKVKGGKK